MSQRTPGVLHDSTTGLKRVTVALALAMLGIHVAHASRFGHAQVLSTQEESFSVAVPLIELTPQEAESIRVSIADAAAWKRAGLTPPTDLSGLRVSVEATRDPSRKTIRVVSSQTLQTSVVDLLFDMRTSQWQRQVQLSLLAPQRGTVPPVSAPLADGQAGPGRIAAATGLTAEGQSASRGPVRSRTVRVRVDDTLSEISERQGTARYGYYQALVALWRANPDAFIQNNMNLVLAGTTLAIPDAQAISVIDEQEARRIYEQQQADFVQYRQRLAGKAGASSAMTADARTNAAGKVGSGRSDVPELASPSLDRLRLSSGTSKAERVGSAKEDDDVQADQRTAGNRAIADAGARVDELEENVKELDRALAGSNGAAGAKTTDGTKSASDAPSGPGAAGATGVTGAAGTAGTVSNSSGGGVALPGPAASSSDPAKPGVSTPLLNTSGLPSWLTDNLLVWLTAALALIAFIIAWVVRRAAARRDDDTYEGDEASDAPRSMNSEAVQRRLEEINLDLNQPPSDEPHPPGNTRP